MALTAVLAACNSPILAPIHFAIARTNASAVAGTIPADNGGITMGIRKISEREELSRSRQRAMSIDEFCERYGVGRTTTYEEIKAERLRARKCGKRTVIAEDDAEDWLRRLPAIEPRAAS